MTPERTYDYSIWHRMLEILSIFALGLLVALMGYEVYVSLWEGFPRHAYWVVPTSALVAYLAADFISGFFHFLGDTFGHEEMPWLGPFFIKPFRYHHVDPREMTRHDFVETNGNNCIICIPTAFFCWYYIPARAELWGVFLLAFVGWFMISIFMTNQTHKWAHLENPPGWIATLQEWRLILHPEHHDIHHTPPFDKYYCITTGWLNPLLYYVGFFPKTERFLRWVTNSPKPPPKLHTPPG